MKSIGIVRRIDELGRIVIPKEIRRTNGIEDGDPMEIYTDGEKIILTKYETRVCVLCGCKDWTVLIERNGKHICKDCIDELVEEVEG